MNKDDCRSSAVQGVLLETGRPYTDLNVRLNLCRGFFILKAGDKLKIKQILNNNAALVSKGTNELVVLAKGVGFKYKIGQQLNESEVQKVFVLDTHDMMEHFSYLLNKTDISHIEMVLRIVNYAKETYQLKMSDYIYLTLIDHIEYTLKRYKEGVIFHSPLKWEVKRFYKKEYEIGLKALEIINEETHINMNEEEAISLALHFINIQTEQKDIGLTAEITAIVQDVVQIVQYEYNKVFDETSFTYTRFLTHLHYFAQKIVLKDPSNDENKTEENNDLYQEIKKLYPKAHQCVQKIKLYIYNTFHSIIKDNEELYLMIHIQQLTQRSK